jgi:hypothetical protein
MRQFRGGLPGWGIPGGRLRAVALLTFVIILGLSSSLIGQGYAGANKSDDPCYKIKQMKKMIMESAEYKNSAGARDPAYIQCTPLTIFLTWKLTDSIAHQYGKDWITLELNEEYPAYLMLHYGWFDRLKKKDLWRYEISGPEPCEYPCPGRAKTGPINLEGEAVICMDYYQNCKPKALSLDSLHYEVSPVYKGSQNALFRVGWEEGRTSGQICSSDMRAKESYKPRGQGVRPIIGHFWDYGGYKIDLNGTGINTNFLHGLSLNSDWPAEEIFEGLRTGLLTKVLTIKATEPAIVPGSPVYSLQGTVTVKIAFAPIKEERWRMTVKAHEMDTNKPDYVFKDPSGKSLQAAVRADFDVTLVSEFIVRKIKDEWSFKEGTVTQAVSSPAFSGLPAELFKCSVSECPGGNGISSMAGNVLNGAIEGKKVKLTWSAFQPRASACVFCKALKSTMSMVPYKQEFGSGELVYNLNKEVLPLQSGLTVNRKVGSFLTYTISLIKIQ